MDLIGRMHRGLSRRFPEERFEAGEGWIRYLPSTEDGYEVAFEISENDYVVMFDGWHDHFDIEEEALDMFVVGLSEDCRLAITARGGRPYHWAVEILADDGHYKTAFIMGTIPWFFWRRRIVDYRQNHLPVCRR